MPRTRRRIHRGQERPEDIEGDAVVSLADGSKRLETTDPSSGRDIGSAVLRIQRAAGNRATTALLSEGGRGRGASDRAATVDPQLAFVQRDLSSGDGSGLSSYAYDPSGLLDEPGLNPAFVSAARDGLGNAVAAGFRPRVREAYRSAERSDELYKAYIASEKKGPRAAPGWSSVHNFGLALDVYLYDANGHLIESPRKGWYKEYKAFSAHLTSVGLEWGEPINDTDHFEFHPTWQGLAGGPLLKHTRKWAMDLAEAIDKGAGASVADWLQFFWFAAGAGGHAPVTTG